VSCTETAAESLRDLRIGEVVYVAERERNLLLRGQLRKCRPQCVARRQNGRDIRTVGCAWLLSFGDEAKWRLSRLRDTPSTDSSQSVAHSDAMDPGFERRRVAEFPDRNEDIDRDILRHIRGLVATAQNRACRTQSKPTGVPSESFSCLAVARLESPDVVSADLRAIRHRVLTT
jgi:hypothetical protein